MMKTRNIRIGRMSIEVRGNKMLGLKNDHPDSLLGVAKLINEQYTPQCGIPRNALIKMAIRGLDAWNLFASFRGMGFKKLIVESEENTALAGKLGMSKGIYARFIRYMCFHSSLDDVKEMDEKLYKKTRARMARQVEKILKECRAPDETLDFFRFLTSDAKDEAPDTSRPKLGKLLRELEDWLESAAWPCQLFIMESKAGTYKKWFVETKQLLAPCKKAESGCVFAESVWINENKLIAYGTDRTRYPEFVKTSVLDLLACHIWDDLETIIKAAKRNGVKFKTLMAQCREEVNSGADVSEHVQNVTRKNHGILQFIEKDEYNDGSVSKAKFDRIWDKIWIEDFMDEDGFIRDRDSEIREHLLKRFSHATFEQYKNDEEFDQSIVEDYEYYCEDKLVDYIASKC